MTQGRWKNSAGRGLAAARKPEVQKTAARRPAKSSRGSKKRDQGLGPCGEAGEGERVAMERLRGWKAVRWKCLSLLLQRHCGPRGMSVSRGARQQGEGQVGGLSTEASVSPRKMAGPSLPFGPLLGPQ